MLLDGGEVVTRRLLPARPLHPARRGSTPLGLAPPSQVGALLGGRGRGGGEAGDVTRELG